MPALDSLVHAIGPHGFAIPPGPGLFLSARPHCGLDEWSDLTGWQPWRHHATAWDTQGRRRIDEPTGQWPMVFSLPGKSRDEILASFAIAHDMLEPGGVCITALANDCGAARFEKQLAATAGHIESIQKNKCRAFLARRDRPWCAETLAAWRALAAPTCVAGTSFRTSPGVFSAGRVDAGSALLADWLPRSLRGRGADLGAGWGFLSHALLSKCPQVKSIDLYEADARALALARDNLAAASAARAGCEVGFHWHDVSAGLPDTVGYDFVVMNPPFHDGRRTDVSLGEAFIGAAEKALKPGGSMILVANRQLPYESVLGGHGMRPHAVYEDATYKVLTARR